MINKSTIFKVLGSLFLLLMIPVGVILVQQVVRYFSQASGIPANLIVDMSTSYGTAPDTWRYLGQGGEERGRMLAPVIGQVKALRPFYIRIDHIFDFYGGPTGSDFTQLDPVISDITATGAKPFISLSYMPTALAQGGNINNPPNNWADWEALIQKTVEHVSGKGGLNLDGVYYEVWNEPDLFGGYKIGGSKNYLDLYYHTVIGAQRAKNVNSFKIGGPATTGYYPNWMTGLLNYVSKNGLRLDFLSWHDYSKSLDSYLNDTNGARGLLATYNLTGREMIISEIGPNGAVDPVYDSKFGAIHALATSVILQNEVSKTFTFEIIDGPGEKQYWGRWGLLTNPKFGTPVAKPRYYAIQFLNNLIGGTKLLVLGQGSWIKSMAKSLSDSMARIIVVNYDPAGKHEEFVPIKLVNLKSGNFTFKRTDFLGATKSQDVATSSAEWQTYQDLKPNSAAIFEVTYK